MAFPKGPCPIHSLNGKSKRDKVNLKETFSRQKKNFLEYFNMICVLSIDFEFSEGGKTVIPIISVFVYQ